MPTADFKYPSFDLALPDCSTSFIPSHQKEIERQAIDMGNVKEVDWKEYNWTMG